MKKNDPAKPEERSLEELNRLVEELGALAADQQEEIKTLNVQLKTVAEGRQVSRQPVARGRFELNGEKYAVLYGVQVAQDGVLRTVSPADIEREAWLQEMLIELQSGAIKLIV